jgi:DNA-binding MarR family transcriptional regulator
MSDEEIKEAFEKIREDMLFLSRELLSIKEEIQELRMILHSNTYPTHNQHPTHNPTHDLPSYSLNQPNFHSSIGNEGVPTNRQQTDNRQSNTLNRTFNNSLETPEIASILGNLKQDLREKFKKLTKQEFLIFSVLYTLEEELKSVTYKDIAQRTGLAESSVRDYILKIEHKGLPITKERINNKIVLLKIPREFKEMTTLNSLRELNSNYD